MVTPPPLRLSPSPRRGEGRGEGHPSKLWFLALAIALSTPTHAAPAYHLDRPRIALGEPIILTLKARPGVLETLDLKPLAADFEIQARTLNRSEGEESLALTLYPLRPGHIVLPTLALPALGLRGRPPTVNVDAQSENVPKVRLALETEPARPVVRQPTRLTLEACDDGSLDWKRPLLPTREGMHLRPLGEQQMDVEREGERCTAHRWHWALLPTAAGRLDLAPPMLEAGKFGQRLRFPAPAARLDIRPVPAWLPAEAAVGRPRISAAPLPQTWPVERPLAWRIEIAGGYSADALRQLLALQLAGHPGFASYPPGVEMLKPESADVATPRLAVTLYAVPGQTGPFALPALGLPWFDPASGRLDSLALPGHSLEIVNPLHARLRQGGLVLLALGVLAILAHRAYRTVRWRLARRRGLKAIADAKDIPALIQAVRGFSLESGTSPAPTLGAWRERRSMEDEGLEALIAALEAAGYGGLLADLPTMKDQARKVLGRMSPT